MLRLESREPDHIPYPFNYQPRERPRRSAADFPAALLPVRWWAGEEPGTGQPGT
jgi:hypothetical protein